jgi:hypothetical protein
MQTSDANATLRRRWELKLLCEMRGRITVEPLDGKLSRPHAASDSAASTRAVAKLNLLRDARPLIWMQSQTRTTANV